MVIYSWEEKGLLKYELSEDGEGRLTGKMMFERNQLCLWKSSAVSSSWWKEASGQMLKALANTGSSFLCLLARLSAPFSSPSTPPSPPTMPMAFHFATPGMEEGKPTPGRPAFPLRDPGQALLMDRGTPSCLILSRAPGGETATAG